MGADVNVMALQNAMKGPRKNAAILDQAFLAGEDLALVPIHDIGQGTGKGSHCCIQCIHVRTSSLLL